VKGKGSRLSRRGQGLKRGLWEPWGPQGEPELRRTERGLAEREQEVIRQEREQEEWEWQREQELEEWDESLWAREQQVHQGQRRQQRAQERDQARQLERELEQERRRMRGRRREPVRELRRHRQEQRALMRERWRRQLERQRVPGAQRRSERARSTRGAGQVERVVPETAAPGTPLGPGLEGSFASVPPR